MSETPELLSCPFECGKPMNFEGIPQRGVFPDASFRLYCMCGARGPKGATPAEAITAWNTRARPAMPEGMREAVERVILGRMNAAVQIAQQENYTPKDWASEVNAGVSAILRLIGGSA